MRRRNWWLVSFGWFLISIVAPAIFIIMFPLSLNSGDPAALIEMGKQVAIVVGALGLVMLVVGLVGRKG